MISQVGLYFHIPFCAQKCDYCDFYSVSGDKTLMDSYAHALAAHIKETAPRVDATVDTVYIGGGTPSWWGDRRIGALLAQVHKQFKVSPKAEITLEANPDSVTPKSLKAWRKAGVNRLSLGVQSLDDATLRSLGRLHDARTAHNAILAAIRAGFDNISADLLYGLPDQSLERWQDTLRQAASWPVTHLSCYCLKTEKGTAFYDRWGDTPVADDELTAEQYLFAVEYLESRGFSQYEISNFAKPSRLSRHNMKYWRLEPYIGFGPAAHSDFGGLRYAYVRDLAAYIDGIVRSDVIISESERLPLPERAAEYIMLGLRTTYGISEAEYIQKFQSGFDHLLKLLASWQPVGLTCQVNGRWRLTPRGFLVSNRLIGKLLEQTTVS